MSKYNLSEEEATYIFKEIEKKMQNEKFQKKVAHNNNQNFHTAHKKTDTTSKHMIKDDSLVKVKPQKSPIETEQKSKTFSKKKKTESKLNAEMNESIRDKLDKNNYINEDDVSKSKNIKFKQNINNENIKNKKFNESKNKPKNKQVHNSNSDKKDNDELENKDSDNNLEIHENIKNEFSKQQITDEKHENVDDILEDIIPEYNKHLSIEVENIDLTFEISTEKVDTLKETIIRFLKRDKPPKMAIHAINDVSFKIYKGEKIGIIGFNGAGKSTLLKVICGIYKPDKGKVTTYGNISPLLGLGAGFDLNYSGRRNIFFNGAVLGYPRSFLIGKEDEIIEFSELGEYIDIPVKNYSSGMIAKLGFSIATIVDPDILIIDEILGVGDATFAKKSRDKMKSLMDGGTTVLLVSHSIPTIRQICDKVIWIENGKLKEMGEVNKVCDHYLKAAEKATHQQLANIQLR